MREIKIVGKRQNGCFLYFLVKNNELLKLDIEAKIKIAIGKGIRVIGGRTSVTFRGMVNVYDNERSKHGLVWTLFDNAKLHFTTIVSDNAIRPTLMSYQAPSDVYSGYLPCASSISPFPV